MNDDQPVHTWFELTYAQYLTIPRSVLEAMPSEWQHAFVQLLDKLDDKIDWRPSTGRYWVHLRDGEGKFAKDPLMNYRHPSKIPFRQPEDILALY